MYKQQTIVMHVDKGKVFENKDEKGELYFTETDFDTKVEECWQTLLDSKCQPLGINFLAVDENLVAIIPYTDAPMSDLVIPSAGSQKLKVL